MGSRKLINHNLYGQQDVPFLTRTLLNRISGAVRDNEFVREVSKLTPDIPRDMQSVEVIASLSPSQRTEVIDVYTASVSRVFLIQSLRFKVPEQLQRHMGSKR